MKLYYTLGALCALSCVNAHSFLFEPESREAARKQTAPDATGSVGCPSPGQGKVTKYKSGETIDVKYWRNNHIGGFIRYSLVPSGQESKENFDKNAFYYTCRETGDNIKTAGQSWNAGDEDYRQSYTIEMGTKITLPNHLPAGKYTLQWSCFAVGNSYGKFSDAEPTFRSCSDIELTTDGTDAQKPACPSFKGGDRVGKLENNGKDDVCFYFSEGKGANGIPTSLFKGNDEQNAKKFYEYGVPKEIAECQNSQPAAPVDPAPTEPAPVDPAPVDPAPVDPALVDPAPVDPAPTEPAPVDPAPTEPAPSEPAQEGYDFTSFGGGQGGQGGQGGFPGFGGGNGGQGGQGGFPGFGGGNGFDFSSLGGMGGNGQYGGPPQGPSEGAPQGPPEAGAPPTETQAPPPAETQAPPPAETQAPPPAETQAPPSVETQAPPTLPPSYGTPACKRLR